MTTQELKVFIGQTGKYVVDDKLWFAVRVMDIRQVFGRVDYLISPATGGGDKWVSSSMVTLD